MKTTLKPALCATVFVQASADEHQFEFVCIELTVALRKRIREAMRLLQKDYVEISFEWTNVQWMRLASELHHTACMVSVSDGAISFSASIDQQPISQRLNVKPLQAHALWLIPSQSAELAHDDLQALGMDELHEIYSTAPGGSATEDHWNSRRLGNAVQRYQSQRRELEAWLRAGANEPEPSTEEFAFSTQRWHQIFFWRQAFAVFASEGQALALRRAIEEMQRSALNFLDMADLMTMFSYDSHAHQTLTVFASATTPEEAMKTALAQLADRARSVTAVLAFIRGDVSTISLAAKLVPPFLPADATYFVYPLLEKPDPDDVVGYDVVLMVRVRK